MTLYTFKAAALAAIAVTLTPLAARAQTSSLSLAESRSNLMAYAGRLALSRGYHDRTYAGFFYNQYLNGVGLHADVVTVSRESDSTFGAVGVSWDVASNIRPKIMFGTSTDNRDIHPDQYVSFQVQVRSASDSRTIVTPSLTYRHFRTGAQEVMPGVDAVYYFSLPGDQEGYYVAQAGANLSISPHNSADGYTIGGGLQTVRSSGLSFGGYVEGGRLVYDALIGSGVKTQFYSVRPSVGLRLNPTWELFARGEYTHTDFYEIKGGLVGVKYTF
jgi:hypothetical protein